MIYQDLRNAIQNDLGGRQDLVPSYIDIVVAQRVNLYQTEAFASQSVLDFSITTTPGVSIYPNPQYTTEITGMWYLLGGTTWIKLWPENFELLVELDDIQPTVESPPNLYAMYGDTFKLYLTPDNYYPLKIACTKKIPPPVNDGDQNFWTNEAFALIEYAADAVIARGFLNLPSMADEYDGMAVRELQRLREFSEILQSSKMISGHMQ